MTDFRPAICIKTHSTTTSTAFFCKNWLWLLVVLFILNLVEVPKTTNAFILFGIHPFPPNQLTGSHNQNKQKRRRSLVIDSSSDSITDGTNGDTSASTLRSISFRGLDKSKQPGLLCDLLMEIGACSTSIVDTDKDTDREVPIYGEPTADSTAAMIYDDPAVGKNVWQRCTVDAQFPASIDLDFVLSLAMETLNINLDQHHVTEVPNRDWVVHVQQSWKPIVVEGIVLKFPWHTDDDVQEQVDAFHDENSTSDDPPSPKIIELEGGIAFGTGEHPTTQMCLAFVQKVFQQEKQDTKYKKLSVLDYGSGSGVLGLAACAMGGSSVSSIGVEIDADAVRIANANAKTNDSKMVNYLPPLLQEQEDEEDENYHDDESKSILMKSLAQQQQQQDSSYDTDDDVVKVLPKELNGPIYDVCVSNILAGPLITLSPTIAGLMKPGAPLGLSGILTTQADSVIEAYQSYFDNLQVGMERRGWVLITGERRK